MGKKSEKHLGLNIIRGDIAALQPVFAEKVLVEPGEPKF